MFEKASKLKLRFPSTRGLLNVEDLWDLSLVDLNEVAKSCYTLVKEDEISFIEEVKPQKEVDNLRLDIVKYVIDSQLARTNEASLEMVKADKKRKILEILASKQDESLNLASEEDLKQMLSEL